MELASMLDGGRFTDRPPSVCPIVGAILRAYNDNLDDARRQDLYRFAADCVGTRGEFSLQLRRARVALAWARDRYADRSSVLRRRPQEPEPDFGPDRIAGYVIGAIGRRHSDDSHDAVMSLLDGLIAMGVGESLIRDFVEHPPEAIEDGGGGGELLIAELGEGRAEPGLHASAPLLDESASAVGQLGQHHAAVALGAGAGHQPHGGETLEHLGHACGTQVCRKRQLARGHVAVLPEAEEEPVLCVAEPAGLMGLSSPQPSHRGHGPLERSTELLGRIELVRARRGLRHHLATLIVHAAIASAIVSAATRD
jgi:hypothetical protein